VDEGARIDCYALIWAEAGCTQFCPAHDVLSQGQEPTGNCWNLNFYASNSYNGLVSDTHSWASYITEIYVRSCRSPAQCNTHPEWCV
jgi:hypothetical protein